PNGAPKDEEKKDDTDAKAETPNPKPQTPNSAPGASAPSAPALTESKTASMLVVVADTDWLFDDYTFDPRMRQAGIFYPLNDNYAFAANATDFLAGSQDL